jgi:cytochrome P450
MPGAVFSTGSIPIPRQSALHTLRTLGTAATQGILPALIEAWKTQGDLCEIRLGPYRFVLVVQPNHIRQVMVEDREVFTKELGAGLLMERVRAFFGDGLLTSEGDIWRRQRRLLQPSFTAQAVTQFASLMLAEANAALDRRRGGPPFDVMNEMTRLTMNVICRSIFGYAVGNDLDRLAKALTDAFETVMNDLQTPLAIPASVPIPRNRKFRRVIAELDALVHEIIAARRNQPSAEPRLLDDMLNAEQPDGSRGMSAKQLRDEIVTMFVAGHETTALALTWSFYLLAHHPEAERRMHAELDSVLAGRPLQIADIERLPYTAAVFQEAMRLYPPFLGTLRGTARDHHIGGRTIRKGTLVLLSPFLTQRHPDFWNSPDAFRPERFLGEAAKQMNRYAYFPFGMGPRTCMGIHFANLEGLAVLATVAQRYRMVQAARKAVAPVALGSLRPAAPIRMKLIAREPERFAAENQTRSPAGSGPRDPQTPD